MEPLSKYVLCRKEQKLWILHVNDLNYNDDRKNFQCYIGNRIIKDVKLVADTGFAKDGVPFKFLVFLSGGVEYKLTMDPAIVGELREVFPNDTIEEFLSRLIIRPD